MCIRDRTSGCTASSRRIPEKSVAENLLEACRKEMVATIQRITRKEKSENPPPLYDLTTLQRDANRLLGYSAQQTLDLSLIHISYDIVEGPMADDTIWDYVNGFTSGQISREAFWALAKFKHPTHQISFHTVNALHCLAFERSEPIHDRKAEK